MLSGHFLQVIFISYINDCIIAVKIYILNVLSVYKIYRLYYN